MLIRLLARRLVAPLLLAVSAVTPCGAAWMHCSATGASDTGAFAYLTTIADVRDTSAAGLQRLQAELAHYITKADTSARKVSATCSAYENENAAAQQYSRALNGTTRKLGWDHVTALAPSAWLAGDELVETPLDP